MRGGSAAAALFCRSGRASVRPSDRIDAGGAADPDPYGEQREHLRVTGFRRAFNLGHPGPDRRGAADVFRGSGVEGAEHPERFARPLILAFGFPEERAYPPVDADRHVVQIGTVGKIKLRVLEQADDLSQANSFLLPIPPDRGAGPVSVPGGRGAKRDLVIRDGFAAGVLRLRFGNSGLFAVSVGLCALSEIILYCTFVRLSIGFWQKINFSAFLFRISRVFADPGFFIRKILFPLFSYEFHPKPSKKRGRMEFA